MKKRSRSVRLGSVLLMFILLPLAIAIPAHADVNDFTITQFNADYTLSNTDKQGAMDITEHIAVTFTDNNHGILRALPETYKKHRLQLKVQDVSSPSGAPTQYTTYQSGGNLVLKIGNPNQTVTGSQAYDIHYSIHNVITFYPDHDELYWDINGDQWGQAAEHVSSVLHVPSGLRVGHKPICYAGSYGSLQHECTVTHNSAAQTIQSETTKPLAAYQTLSIVAGFDKGYFQPSPWYETAGEYAGTAAKFLIPFLLLGGAAGLHWRTYGRDPKGRGTIVPEYEAPDGLSPLEAGTVADFKTDNRDITATIIDLAIRRYLKIIETVTERKLRRDTKTYSFRLENADFTALNSFEKTIIKSIFIKQVAGEEVDMSALKYKLATTATTLRKSVHRHLVVQGYFRKTPLSTTLKFAGLLAVLFGVNLVFAAIVQGAAVAGVIAGAATATIFILFMPSRTPKGVAAKDSMLGLKYYLKTAEAERIKKLQSPSAPYAEKSAEPKRTVNLFEKLLPFAMVLGVEGEWATQFEGIYQTPPDWYQGNWTTFNAVYLASSLNSGVQTAVNTAFSAPGSSSGSGFSGGGSGGGGGGGGGGGW